jgi:hypothetical protein
MDYWFIWIDLICLLYKIIYYIILGIGDWGLGIGDWGLGPIPNPQSPNMRYNFYIKVIM